MLFSPAKYLQFVPPKAGGLSQFASLDKLVRLRDSAVRVVPGEHYHYAEIGDIDVNTGGVTFHPMKGYRLPTDRPAAALKGDVLVSTVRTNRGGIGQVMLDATDTVTTKAVLNICGVTDHAPGLTVNYVYAFLRSDFFTEQVWSMITRGVYPRMDKGALGKVFIPVPGDERAVRYLSVLSQAAMEKEQLIRDRSAAILDVIDGELRTNQKNRKFVFELPTSADLRKSGRLDARIHDEEYKSKIWLVENYLRGFATPHDDGFKVTPGPSLEMRILGTRIDSDSFRDGYYALILPTNISSYGTVDQIIYMGTGKKLPLLQEGDIVFGEAGFEKGRSVVLLNAIKNCTTNAHGLYARREDGNIDRSVFFRCVFHWYRSVRLIDIMAVGGSGGHFSPEYFDYLRIPNFPDDVRATVVKLYHNRLPPPPAGSLTLDNFVERHRRRNTDLGLWQLDREMKDLWTEIAGAREEIISGRAVHVPL